MATWNKVFFFALGLVVWSQALPMAKKTKLAPNSNLKLKLIHINDIHAHFEQVNENTGRCHKDQEAANNCFGGAARIKTAADQIRNKDPDIPSIFLNAGDYYQVC